MDGRAKSMSHYKEKTNLRTEKRDTLTIVLFAIYVIALIGIILIKPPFYSEPVAEIREINLLPFPDAFDDNHRLFSRDVIYNIFAFIPLGIYICSLKLEWSFAKKIIPIAALTLAFEIMQYIFALGRSDITDIITNMLGGILGIGICAIFFKIFKKRTTTIVNILSLIFIACLLLLLAFLFL